MYRQDLRGKIFSLRQIMATQLETLLLETILKFSYRKDPGEICMSDKTYSLGDPRFIHIMHRHHRSLCSTAIRTQDQAHTLGSTQHIPTYTNLPCNHFLPCLTIWGTQNRASRDPTEIECRRRLLFKAVQEEVALYLLLSLGLTKNEEVLCQISIPNRMINSPGH